MSHDSVPFLPWSACVPIVGGNCDNGSKCGRYLNVNNTAGNARWNIGASLILALSFTEYLHMQFLYSNNVSLFPQHLLKINLLRGTASKRGESPSQRRGGDKKGEPLEKL